MAQNTTVSITDSSLQQQFDHYMGHVTLQPSKLDADQYMADDIDGVTESLFGSGNLNYLSLQAGQTNALLTGKTAFENSGNAENITTGLPDTGGIAPLPDNVTTLDNMFGNSGTTNSVRDIDTTPEVTLVNTGSENGFTNGTLCSLGASNFSSTNGGGNPFTSSNGSDGIDGLDTTSNGQNGLNGTNGNSGQDGKNGNDGTGSGGGDTYIYNKTVNIIDFGDVNIIDVDITDIDIGDVINLGDINLGDINLGDVIIELGDINVLVDATLDVLVQITNNLNIDQIIDLTEITNNTVNNVFNVVNTLINNGLNLEGPLIDLDLVNNLSQVTNLDLDLAVLKNPVLNIAETVNLNPVLKIIGLNGGNNNGDTDLVTDIDIAGLNIDLAEIDTIQTIDLVEDIIGDVDLVIGGNLDLLNLGGSETDNDAGDSDLVLDLDLDLIDNDLLSPNLEVELDAVENIVGDIDLDIGAALDVLGDQADNVVDALDGGSGDGVLADIGDTVEDIVADIIPGLPGSENDAPDVDLDGDINLLGNDVADPDLESVLDPIEAIVGDAELDTDLGLDLLNPDAETDNDAGDEDIDTDIDLDLAGHDVIEIDFIDVDLDPIENIVGDIDLDVDAALDLLNPDEDDGGVNDLASNVVGGVEDTLDEILSWPESILPEGEGLFNSGNDTEGEDLGNVLPDPVGDGCARRRTRHHCGPDRTEKTCDCRSAI